MDGRSMIWVLNVVETILESSHVDDQPERIQAILKWTIRKHKQGCELFHTFLSYSKPIFTDQLLVISSCSVTKCLLNFDFKMREMVN
jgi:hypothetical protein